MSTEIHNQLTDEKFMQKVQDLSLEKIYFSHYGHLRAAWYFLMHNDYETASNMFKQGLKAYAASINASQIYHESLTQIWLYIIHQEIQQYPNAKTFAEFYQQRKNNLTKEAPYQYYSKEVLDSERAKKEWVDWK